MEKVFFETSVLIRFLTRDDEEKYQDCVTLFELVEEGKLRPYISNIVIMEILFILERHYKFPKKKILVALDKLLQLRNLTVIEETDTRIALELFANHSVKYGACLIVSQVPSAAVLVTYDRDFSKMTAGKTASPGVFLEDL